MRTINTIIAATFIAASTITTAFAYDHFTPEEIEALPQDKVAAAKRQCAAWFGSGSFQMQLSCEDQQFTALRELIERRSVKAKGDKL